MGLAQGPTATVPRAEGGFGYTGLGEKRGIMPKRKRPRRKVSDNPRRYRVLAEQPYSVLLESPASFQVGVGSYECTVYFKPAQADPSHQRTQGGALVQIEYVSAENDMLRAAALGIQLIEDVSAGLAVVTGIPFGGVTFIQLLDLTGPDRTPFLFSVTPYHLHSNEPISDAQLSYLRGMLAHWDGLPRGERLRRAASLYRRALRQEDDLSAFQYSYMGLEALEPLLAEQHGVSAGVEESQGKCKKCGQEYVRRRTVLSGVRAYITGGTDSKSKHADRQSEWKLINDLRQKQVHSLEDLEDLYSEARSALPAAAHFLHDAICCLSHQHNLESPAFSMPRGERQIVFQGIAEPAIPDSLEQCRPIVEFKALEWTPHKEYRYVPELRFCHNRPGCDVGGRFFWLLAPVRLASEDDLVPADFETGEESV